MRYKGWHLYRPHCNRVAHNHQWISSYFYAKQWIFILTTLRGYTSTDEGLPPGTPGWRTCPTPPAPAPTPSALDSTAAPSDAGSQHRVLWASQKGEGRQNVLHVLKSEFTGRVRELFYLLPLWTPGMESISISLKHHLFQFNRKLLFNEILDW